jgi:2,3-bisphosphoglycerate-independent phosphoglycerate mutase
MKYIVVLGDGMADRPLDELGGRTPLEAARKPNMDMLARSGMVGLVKTVPDGMSPGSDTANLSVLGYDPRTCYTGRSPLEAVSMGISLAPGDVALRCNLVTLSGDDSFEASTLIDYSSGEISTEESTELIAALRPHLKSDKADIYPGISYRHCLVLHDTETGSICTPPHDISGRPIRNYLPGGNNGELLLDMMKLSYRILRDHPVNRSRIARGLNPANSCWFWGEGTAPSLPSFRDKYGLAGGIVSAVDLVKGIGICAGMKIAEVQGATGNINTNFRGKADAALEFLKGGLDFVYIHVEAPDECGHQGNASSKVKSVELIDSELLGRLLEGLDEAGFDYSLLLMPDHPTPVPLRTHTSDPIPFVIYRSGRKGAHPTERYTEALSSGTGIYISEGHTLLDMFIHGQ